MLERIVHHDHIELLCEGHFMGRFVHPLAKAFVRFSIPRTQSLFKNLDRRWAHEHGKSPITKDGLQVLAAIRFWNSSALMKK